MCNNGPIRQFEDFVGFHAGESALVCGNGPSIRMHDPEWFVDWDGPTFGVNRIYYWFSPDYYFNIYTLGNVMCLPQSGEKVPFLWNEPLNRISARKNGRLNIHAGISMTSLTAAYQMGCKEINLIGVDGCPDKSGKPYFYSEKKSGFYFRSDKRKLNFVERFRRAIETIRSRGVKVIQHNPEALIQ